MHGCGWQWSGNTTITDNLLIVIWHKTSLCCIGSSSLLKTMISSAFNESGPTSNPACILARAQTSPTQAKGLVQRLVISLQK